MYTNQELALAIKQACQVEVIHLDAYLANKNPDTEHNYLVSMGSTEILKKMAGDRGLEIFY